MVVLPLAASISGARSPGTTVSRSRYSKSPSMSGRHSSILDHHPGQSYCSGMVSTPGTEVSDRHTRPGTWRANTCTWRGVKSPPERRTHNRVTSPTSTSSLARRSLAFPPQPELLRLVLSCQGTNHRSIKCRRASCVGISNPVPPWSLHSDLYRDAQMHKGRQGSGPEYQARSL